MISVNDLRPGITFEHNKNIYIVVSSQHSKSGRGQAHVKAKVKNLRSKDTTTITFTGGEKVEKAFIEQRSMQFLYDNGSFLVFMDINSYEQSEIPMSNITNELLFLKEGSEVMISKYNEEILGLVLPTNVILKVISVEGGIKGDSTSGANQKAILETGLEIFVPLFIKSGENIVVAVVDKKYVGRSSSK